MSSPLDSKIMYLPGTETGTQVVTDKGQKILEGLLLEQYQNSPNLKEYFMAFIAEMDFLFEQIEEVYVGRFLEDAVGAQLDVIGIILQQPRSVILPKAWFGFVGAPLAQGMANESTPSDGGIFRDENVGEDEIVPLDDKLYRRVLLAKAFLTNRDSADISLVYYIISILLGRVPSTFVLRDGDSGAGIEKRRVDLLVSTTGVNDREIQIIYYMSEYFVPSGINFTITQV